MFGSHICFYCHEGFTAIHKYFTFGRHFSSFTSMTIYVFLTWQTYLFSSLISITLKLYIHTTYTQYLFPLSVTWQSQIFSLHSHICSFTSMITFVTNVSNTYSQELHSVYMHTHTFMQFCLHPSIHAYINTYMSAYMHP